MYRIPEKQFRKPNGLELRYTLFLSVCKSPTQSLTFHRIEISWLFFTTFRFDSFHFILFCASWALSCEFTLSKGKKLRGNVVFTTTAICIYFASLTLICKLLFIRRISLETKMSILNSQMLAFLGTLFILAIKILKAKLQTFHSNVLMRESYEKCCNWLKSRNTL